MTRKRKRPSKADDLSDPKRQKSDSTATVQSPEDQQQSKHLLLSRYYPTVSTLREYFLSRLPATSKTRRKLLRNYPAWVPNSSHGKDQGHQTPKQSLSCILDTTLVGYDNRSPGTSSSSLITPAIARDFATFAQAAQLPSTVSLSPFKKPTGPQHLQQVPHSQLVEFALHQLFTRIYATDTYPPHVLCDGYAKPSTQSSQDSETENLGLECKYVNDQVERLKGEEWAELSRLLGRDGDVLLLAMIWEKGTGVFAPIETGERNLLQICGQSLGDMKVLEKKEVWATSSHASKVNPRKAEASTNTQRSPNQIVFVRNRMLYARPQINAQGEVKFGLPHIHILNRCVAKLRKTAPSSPSSRGNFDDQLSTVAEQDPTDTSPHLDLLKYIFPLQHDLDNVFTSPAPLRKQTTHPFKDYMLREGEIQAHINTIKARLGAKKQAWSTTVPKRLRGEGERLIKTMVNRYARTSFSQLLFHYCPIEVVGGSSDLTPRVAITRKGSQQCSESTSSKLARIGEKVVRKKNGQSGDLTDTETPVACVSAFARSAVANVFPSQFFGQGKVGKTNWRVLMKAVDAFVNCARFERMSLHEAMQGIQIKGIQWLEPNGARVETGDKPSKADFDKRKELLHELVYYMFDSFLIPLLRTNFHITESNTNGSRLFYFSHDVWRAFTEAPLAAIKSSMLIEIPRKTVRTLINKRQLGYSHMRLAPKGNTVRPLMNMRRKPILKTQGGQVLGYSVNDKLKQVVGMLNFEKQRGDERLGSSMFSVGDLYPKLQSYRAKLGSTRQPFYFVKVDVAKCFDNIPQKRIVDLMNSLCTEDEYIFRRHAEVKQPQGSAYPSRKFPVLARAGDDLTPFQELLDNQLAVKKRGTVFVDKVSQREFDGRKLLQRLDEHLEHNWVKVGKRFYRQKQGIPQGSSVSSLLCNLFYADFEHNELGFLKDDNHLLARLIDDFLLVTTNKDHARRFLQIMHNGNEEYGMQVKPEKTLVNFSVSINGLRVKKVNDALFPYCGVALNTKTLEVSKDMSRRLETRIRDSLTVEHSKLPGQAFHRKSIQSFKNQLYAMLTDSSISRRGTIASTIYFRFLETAMKMHRYVKSMPRRNRANGVLMIRTTSTVMEMAFALVKGREGNACNAEYRCELSKAHIQWLAASAFRHVLGRKQSQYHALLRWLDESAASIGPRGGREIARLRQITQKGNALFEGYRY